MPTRPGAAAAPTENRTGEILSVSSGFGPHQGIEFYRRVGTAPPTTPIPVPVPVPATDPVEVPEPSGWWDEALAVGTVAVGVAILGAKLGGCALTGACML